MTAGKRKNGRYIYIFKIIFVGVIESLEQVDCIAEYTTNKYHVMDVTLN